MRAVIPISRAELVELGTLFALANTPGSLYSALVAHPVVQRLRAEMGPDALGVRFRQLTARGRRTELSLGLAYAVLTAIVTHEEAVAVPDSADRLEWSAAFVHRGKARAASLITTVNAGYHVRASAEALGSAALQLPAHHAE
jgi:hypothetical protein